MVGALELDAASHGDVGVGVTVVHAGPRADDVHDLEELVEEEVVGRVGVVVFVGFNDGDDERHVPGGDAVVPVAIAGVVPAAALEVLGEDGEGGEGDGVHRLVDLVDGGAAAVFAAGDGRPDRE